MGDAGRPSGRGPTHQDLDSYGSELIAANIRLRPSIASIVGWSAAEDLLAEVMARMIDKFVETGFKPAQVVPYMRKAAIRDAYRLTRKAGMSGIGDQAIEDLLAFYTQCEVDPSDTVMIAQALMQLPLSEARAVTAVLMWELTYAEAAEVLGVPSGTLHGQVQRGKAKLLKAMTDEMDR